MCGVKIILIFKCILIEEFHFSAGNVIVQCETNVSTSSLQNTMMTPSELNETTNTHVTTAHHISETITKEEHNNRLGSSDHNSLCRLFHTVPWKLRNSSDFYGVFLLFCISFLFIRSFMNIYTIFNPFQAVVWKDHYTCKLPRSYVSWK